MMAITIPAVAPPLSADDSWRTAGDVATTSWEKVVVEDIAWKIEAANKSAVCSTSEMLRLLKSSALTTAARSDHNIIKRSV